MNRVVSNIGAALFLYPTLSIYDNLTNKATML